MLILSFVLFLIISAGGLVVIPLGLPGTFIIAGSSAIIGFAGGWQVVTVPRLLLFFGLAVAGELIDLGLGVFGGKSFGASKLSMAGAFIGGLVGAFLGLPLPFVGNLVGAFVGAFIGAFLLELLATGDPYKGFKSGFGAFFGRIMGSLIKLSLGVTMIVMVIFAFAN